MDIPFDQHAPEHLAMIKARREALLRINPHFFYDPAGVYRKEIIPRGTWITLELGVRSFGWGVVEQSPDVQRMLNQVPRAACEYVNEAVIKLAHRQDQA
jgi:hypothetical protein